jgi:hypothetical protein
MSEDAGGEMNIHIQSVFTARIVKWIFRRKLTTLKLSFERSYYDDEQIHSAFVRQYVTELRDVVENHIAELSKEVGEKL